MGAFTYAMSRWEISFPFNPDPLFQPPFSPPVAQHLVFSPVCRISFTCVCTLPLPLSVPFTHPVSLTLFNVCGKSVANICYCIAAFVRLSVRLFLPPPCRLFRTSPSHISFIKWQHDICKWNFPSTHLASADVAAAIAEIDSQTDRLTFKQHSGALSLSVWIVPSLSFADIWMHHKILCSNREFFYGPQHFTSRVLHTFQLSGSSLPRYLLFIKMHKYNKGILSSSQVQLKSQTLFIDRMLFERIWDPSILIGCLPDQCRK